MKRPFTARGLIFTLFIFTLLLLGIWLRTWQLSTVPIALTYDDLDYVTNGWSFAKTGKDLTSQTSWWRPRPLEIGAITSEIGPHWHFITGLVDWNNPVIGARLPVVLIGFLTVGLFGYLSWLLIQNKHIVIISTIFLLVTPWAVLISRSPIDATFGIFWQLMGLVSVLKIIKTKTVQKEIFWLFIAILSYGLAFYSYHAYKFSILVTVWWMFFYWWWQFLSFRKIQRRKIFVISCLTIFLTVCTAIFFISTNHGAIGSRKLELIFFNSEYLSKQVNLDRLVAIDRPWTSFFFNKAEVVVEHGADHLVKVINPEYLFLHSGDSSVANSFYDAGYLYLVFLPLIIIGLLWFWKVKRPEFWFLIGLTISSLLPVLIQTSFSAVLRSGMFFLFLILFASIGFFYLLKSRSTTHKILAFIIGCILIIQVIFFGQWYFWVYPIKLADAQNVSDRVLAGYLNLVNLEKTPATIIANDHRRSWFRTFAFYNNYFDKDKLLDLQAKMTDQSKLNEIQAGTLLFSESCSATLSAQKTLIMTPMYVDTCGKPAPIDSKNQTISVLSSPSDNRSYFYVFNDIVCNDYDGVPFVNINNHSQLQPEKLSRMEFCQTWVRKEVR